MELYREVEEWTSKNDKYEIMELLALKNRIICTAVRSIDDIVKSEESRRMGPIKKVNDPVAGEMWIPAMPCSSSGMDVKITPPICGEEAITKVFENLLDLSRERIIELSQKQVI
jgi:crotonobetainyl-CoA:carnitine CoA-transferase CaiB-like acyl-CoA transferase